MFLPERLLSGLFYQAMQLIAQATISEGVNIAEVDIDQELNLHYFTVWARLIYDNTSHGWGTYTFNNKPYTMGAVWSTLQSIMQHYNPLTSVTYSVTPELPHSGTANCASWLGDPGPQLKLSLLLSTMSGWLFGASPTIDFSTGIACGGTYPPDYVVTPAAQGNPMVVTTVDVHDYTGALDPASQAYPLDVQTQAMYDYSAIDDTLTNWGLPPTAPPGSQSLNPNLPYVPFPGYWGKTGSIFQNLGVAQTVTRVVIGETWAPSACSGLADPMGVSTANCNGYLSSQLYRNRSVALAPWFTYQYGCSGDPFPLLLNPPYAPTH